MKKVTSGEPIPLDLQAPFIEWGKEAFAHEIEIGFSRAKMFDAPTNRVVFDALDELSTEQLHVLRQILPAQRSDDLTPEEKKVTDLFVDAKMRSYRAHIFEMVAQTTKVMRQPTLGEAKKIHRLVGGIFKEIAKHWGFKIHKEEPRVWMLTSVEKWGGNTSAV